MNSNASNDIEEKLEDFERRLKYLETKMGELEYRISPVVEDKLALFLNVPDTLRKSLFAVSELGEGTAEDVSKITLRHRSIENKYLNELVRGGWLRRTRKGKKVYYSPLKRAEQEKEIFSEGIDEIDRKLEEILG